MRASLPRFGVQRTRLAAVLPAVLGALVAAAGGGTAGDDPADDAPPAALRFELHFEDAVDLDLYVTGPDRETVYYGNTPSKRGGELARDWRCDSPPGPRVEVVTLPEAPPGHYRVGVDFPERCRLGAGTAAFRVVVTGAAAHERRGEIELGRFAIAVLEFDHPGPSAPFAPGDEPR